MSEVTRDSMVILENPKTIYLDNHTHLFIKLCSGAVVDGRKTFTMLHDIKASDIDNHGSARTDAGVLEATPRDTGTVAGIQFALEDELPGEIFPKKNQLGLGAVGKLKTIDEPAWFEDEFEGVVHLEAFMRKYLPPSCTPWDEMSSDDAMSMLAFEGVAQLYLLGKDAWEEARGKYASAGGPREGWSAGEIRGWIGDGRGGAAAHSDCRGTVPQALPKKVPAPEGTQFVVDLTVLSKYEVREHFEKYGAAAFFGKDKEVLAIYCCDIDGAGAPGAEAKRGGYMVTKEDEAWEHAKFVFRSTIISALTLREHLTYTHWIVSNRVSFASRESLGKDHPVRRLLKLFTFRTPTINLISKYTLMAENMLLHRASAFTLKGVLDAFEDAAANFKYRPFPEEMAGKKLPQGMKLPLAEDGVEVWAKYTDFFAEYVDVFYAGDEEVQKDPELQAFWESMEKATDCHKTGTGPSTVYRGYGLPSETLVTKAQLVELLTHSAFWVTAMHEITGNIVEYFESPAFCATKVHKLGPKISGGADEQEETKCCGGGPKASPAKDPKDHPRQTMADVQTFFQDLCVVGSTGYRLPPVIGDWTHLFLENEKKAECVAAHGKFMKALKDLSAEIKQRNARGEGRRRPFDKMDPLMFECSVSI